MHRLPRLHRRLQGGESGCPRREPHVGQVHREGHVPGHAALLLRHALNHCDNAPCVAICPTVALYRRSDGIVDFDGDRCIGCKSCMQACPYDALYIDPETQTAAKCHYCAHRVEVGLEPACVIICPVQAIVPGDLDDPGSRIARVVAGQQTAVRKPEQGTQPKLFYLGADEASLTPALQARGSGYVFAESSGIPCQAVPTSPVPRCPWVTRTS